jgi:hypothetical protein
MFVVVSVFFGQEILLNAPPVTGRPVAAVDYIFRVFNLRVSLFG